MTAVIRTGPFFFLFFLDPFDLAFSTVYRNKRAGRTRGTGCRIDPNNAVADEASDTEVLLSDILFVVLVILTSLCRTKMRTMT